MSAALGAPVDFPIGGRSLRAVLIDSVSLSPAPDMLFQLISYITGGDKRRKARALANGDNKRSPVLGDIPTVAESGVPGFEASSWFGMVAPAKTPETILRRLNAEFVRILHTPELRERLAADGGEPVGSPPAEFTSHLKGEIAKWSKVIAEAGIRAE